MKNLDKIINRAELARRMYPDKIGFAPQSLNSKIKENNRNSINKQDVELAIEVIEVSMVKEIARLRKVLDKFG